MSELASQLLSLVAPLEKLAKESQIEMQTGALRRLRDLANEVGRSWSGSWLGYQSRVYYEGLHPAPAGAHFSVEWGLDEAYGQGTIGEWREYSFESVHHAILSGADLTSLEAFETSTNNAIQAFSHAREEFLSVASVVPEAKSDAFLSRLSSQVEQLKIFRQADFLRAMQPSGKFFSRDMIALGQGFQSPPHIAVLAAIAAIGEAPEKCGALAKILHRAGSHLETRERHIKQKQVLGTNVFIGHGRASAWKDLKDFIQDRMGLPWDEFNRVPIAGTTNIARLSQMLEEAAIAFIVMTAEDEQLDGSVRARMNVIHEAGLFQGKLGFSKAIIILEEGCEEFSNIHGLGQIRFPKGNIKACFEDLRLVLEREHLLD